MGCHPSYGNSNTFIIVLPVLSNWRLAGTWSASDRSYCCVNMSKIERKRISHIRRYLTRREFITKLGFVQVFCSACSFMEPGAFCSCLSFPLSSIITLLCGLVRSLIVNVICLISNHIILYLINFADKITTFPYCINRKAYNYLFRCTPNKKSPVNTGLFLFL